MNDGNPPSASPKSYAAVTAMAAIAALVGFAAVYGTLGQPDNNGMTQSNDQPAEIREGSSRKQAPGLPAFVFKKTPEPLADVNFVDGAGTPKTLKDFRGKTILLNLWATWCAPCRHEMPSLDRLQAELGSDKFEVVALAVDRSGADAAKKFLDDTGVKALKLSADPTTRSGSALKAIGMPTTILIDTEGREIGRLPGPAEWDSADAKRLIAEALR
jgi:thiol-disulfide isomerase/thioredoxin